MIQKLNVKWVRWINLDLSPKKINCLAWKNASGKSTVISLIRDIYRWKTSIKEWETTIMDSDNTLINKNWKLFWKINIWDQMLLMTPWFFMGQKTIPWINKSKEDKRKTISELLWIDRDEFFLDNWVDYNIKWLNQELRDLNTTEIAYWEQLIEAENQLKDLVKVKKPKEIKLTNGNENDLELLKSQLNNLWEPEVCNWLHKKPKEVKLIEWNKHELDNLNNELQVILSDGKSIPSVCDKCWQDIKDADKQKGILRKRYADKLAEINNFKLIEGNINEFNNYKDELNKYNNSIKEKDRIENSNKIISERKKEIEDKIKNFKLIKWNSEEYIEYTNANGEYISYNSKKETLEKRIKEIEDKIKSFNSKEIEDKIKKYKDTEKKFIKWIDNKLILWDLKIIFYRESITPNSDGDMYISDFNIEYKGKLYNELSGWESWVVDIILAAIFINQDKLIDFITIDNAEISEDNIKKVIKDYLWDLQVFYTKISKTDLKVS